MVRSSLLRLSGRVPVIQFRKGGLPGTHAPPPPMATISHSGSQQQQATPISTGVIDDFQLPRRYQRRPISQEEIDHINGGGIGEDPAVKSAASTVSPMEPLRLKRGRAPNVAMIRLPKVRSGDNNEIVLKIILN